ARGRLPRREFAGPLCAPRVPAAPPQAAALDEPAGALARGGQAADEGDRPVPWRDELPEPVLGSARPVHRQRSRTRTHRPGAPTAGADACSPDDEDAQEADSLSVEARAGQEDCRRRTPHHPTGCLSPRPAGRCTLSAAPAGRCTAPPLQAVVPAAGSVAGRRAGAAQRVLAVPTPGRSLRTLRVGTAPARRGRRVPRPGERGPPW